MKLSTEVEAVDGSDKYISKRMLSSIGYNAGKSQYCEHLCRLWTLGRYLGDAEFRKLALNRLRKITLVDEAENRAPTSAEPIWASDFVMNFPLLNYIHQSRSEELAPLRKWAVDVVATRSGMEHWLDAYGIALPRGYMSVYKKKLRDCAAEHKSELKERHELCMKNCRHYQNCGWVVKTV